MSMKESICELIDMMEWWHIEDIGNLRPELERLHLALGKLLAKKPVRLSVKVVNGWDYVYANCNGVTMYLAKHVPNFDRRTMIENLVQPRVWDFILTGKKLNEAKFNRPETVWYYDLSDIEMETVYGERLNGRLECPRVFEYDRRAFEVASVEYADRYQCLHSRLGKLAQITKMGAILKLQRLEEDGYEVLPLRL